jgi:hypothetical protein
MNDPTTACAGSTGDLRPYDHAAGSFRAGRTGAGVTSARADDLVGRGLGKPPESLGGDSKRRLIWGIPVKIQPRALERQSTEAPDR